MIYVNGDSWTSGWPDEETHGHREFAWPYLLGQLLEEPVINDSRAASSNHRIYRRTFDYLLTNRPATAIVFLTHWTRKEEGHIPSGKVYQYLPTRDQAMFGDNWHPYLFYTNFLRQIISLQQTANMTGTKLLLLDTFKNNLQRTPDIEWFKRRLQIAKVFDAMDDDRIAQKFNKITSLNKFIDYNQFISDKSWQELIPDHISTVMHPTSEGHKQMAEIIHSYIRGHNHGKTI